MDKYETTSIASLHSPESHTGAGPLKMIIRKNGSGELVWEFHSSFDSKTSQGLDAGGCVDNSKTIPGGYHCAYRPVTLAWVDPDLPPSHNKGNRSILFKAEKDTGQWVHFVVHYKWDNTGSGGGVLEIWMKRGGESDYRRVVNLRSYVGLMTDDAPYLKMGLSAIDGDACPHLQYYDNLKIGNRNSSFSEVDPSSDVSTSPQQCDSNHLWLCNTSDVCEDAGGNWCSGNCQSSGCSQPSPPEQCDSSHLWLCDDNEVCENAGGHWCSGNCRTSDCSQPSPPGLTLLQPVANLPFGTTSYTVRVRTDIDAECRFQYVPDKSNLEYDYYDMTGVPTQTGSSIHTKTMTKIGTHADFYQYWKCRDEKSDTISAQKAVHVKIGAPAGNKPDTTVPLDEGKNNIILILPKILAELKKNK